MKVLSKPIEKMHASGERLKARDAGASIRLETFLEHVRPRATKHWDVATRTEEVDNRLVELKHLRRKRITFILPKVSYEGVAKVGLLQANLLKAYWHHNVEVISLIKEGQKFKELLEDVRISYAFPIASLSRSFYHFSAQFMRVRSNLIVAHNIPAAVIANKVFKKNKISYLAYIHDAAFNRIPGSFPSFGYDRIREALSKSTIIFTNSLKTLQELRKRYRVDGVPLYPGCFAVEQINNNRSDFFLFVHFISPRSSFNFLAKLVERENIKLVIAGGRRWGWREVLRACQKFGSRVKFIFEPTERELSVLYQRARGLIFPEVENFGLPPLEAGACGCPSIVAQGSGVLEILKDGTEIIACKEGNIEEFGKAVRILKEDGKYVRQLGENVWAAAKRHSWDVHVSKLAQEIESLGGDWDEVR